MDDKAVLDELSQPLTLAGTTLPGRVMCSAMTLQYSQGGLISDRHLAFYRARAEGGVALLFSEQLTATPISDSPFGNAIAAYDERQVEGFQAIADALAPYDTRFFAQLFAGGVAAASTVGLDRWGPPRGPSRVPAPGGELPVPLEVDELARIASDFAGSAAHVQAGSLDGVEVHGSHGWLVGQFLSPFYNRREDAYGGSVENRCRLALEIGNAIRARVGPAFPVGLSLSFDEMIGTAGITPEDTLDQLEVLAGAKVYDFFDLSIGSSHSEHFTIAPMDVEEGFTLEFAAQAKALVAERAAIFVAGRVVDPAMAARAIRDGVTDMVAMSRAHLADPQLVHKALSGRSREIRRCIGANVCVGRALRNDPVACVLTPATGRERTWSHDAPAVVEPGAARRVAIVGAGPAGLRAGAIAAARGHQVVVHERDSEPGGHLRDIAWLPTRGGWADAVNDMVAELERHGGALRLGSDVARESVSVDSSDVILIAAGAEWDATGASASRPERARIPVTGNARMLGLGSALRAVRSDLHGLGRRVLIIDESGDYAPLGLAEALASADVRVTIVTPAPSIGAAAAALLETAHVLPRLRALDVALTVEHDIASVCGSSVELADVWGGTPIRLEGIDAVVLAMGRIPRDELFHELRGRAADVRRIGDALTPRSTAAVIHEAEAIARAL